MTITVEYSCTLCGLVRVPCLVRARETQDVVAWTEQVMIVAIAKDHRRRSATCQAREISEIYVPMTGADRIGGPAVQ